jgi:Transglutaminase-like superfamily/TgpA N-terminal domain
MQDAVRDARVERLTKIISETHQKGGGLGNNKNVGPRRPAFHIHIGLDEGWFSLILLSIVVYSTIWSVQAVNWVDHLNILTLTSLLGLIAGVVAAKLRRYPRLAIHVVAVLLALLIAFWQTSGAFYGGDTARLAHGMHQWFVSVIAGGTGEDDSIFLFFITALGFLLAYSSAWLVYRTRSPWLMIVANAVVLLINLSNVDSGYIIFLVVFLMASLLLLLRFNLFESTRRWRRQGLRYSDDLGWDVMQAGALISIAILVFSWFLPWGYINDSASQVWNANANPWVQLEDTWNRVISLSGGDIPNNHGNFRDTLVLAGNPNLNNDIVFTVQSDDSTQYLESLSYDTYDGRSWSDSSTFNSALQTNAVIPSESQIVHTVAQQINVVNPPGEQYPYILGASQVGTVNLPATVLGSKANDSLVALLSKNGKLTAGEHYTITSYISSADVNSLRTIPMPADSPRFSDTFDGQYPLTYYNPAILSSNVQLPKDLDPNIALTAQRITANASTMYDKVVALETYLHDNFTYSVDVHLPQGQEGVSWFLFRSGNKGFCNYFATAMAVMARSLGIPSRVVVGYTNGQLDAKHHQRVIKGTDAHSWTQVYFAGYGWVNFEPSASFTSFTRPTTNQFLPGTSAIVPTGGVSPSVGKNHKLGKNELPDLGGSTSTGTQGQFATQLGQQASIAFGGVVLLLLFSLLLFSIWWRRLFRHYRLSAQIYGRMCILANWAGIPLQYSQTPHEYIRAITVVAPDEATTLERFEDIYVRELWASPTSAEHPRNTGEVNELPSLWQRLQPRLFFYAIKHPYVLRVLPSRFLKLMRQLLAQRRARRAVEQDL